ncbi:MAG: formate dehydrogenase accessory protein FdhE [Actinomycetota bacterium]
MIVETEDPGVVIVRQVADELSGENPDCAEALALYRELMEAQQELLGRLECTMSLDDEERERRLNMGEPLADPLEVPVDREVFLRLFESLVPLVLDRAEPGHVSPESVLAWDGLGEEVFEETRRRVLAGEELDHGNDWSTEDRNIVSDVFWESLVPFFRKCGSILTFSMEQSMWQRGYCPFCGGAPLMGMLRRDDGLWLLECSLCHTWWNVRRAGCPFCNESEGSLEYLYLEPDPGRRVYHCGSCGTYVKTVDLRGSDRRTLLPMEDIVTVMLDHAAEQEGLKKAPGYR